MNGKEIKAEISREKIIKVALEEFVQYGYKGASTNSICKNARVSKGLLYHYYPSKENLYLSVLENAINDFKNNINIKIIPKEKKGIEYISEYFDMKFKYFTENPLYSKFIPGSILNNDLEEAKLLVKDFEEYNNSLIYEVLKSIDINPKFDVEKAFELILIVGEKLEEKHIKNIENSSVEIAIDEFRKDHKLMIEMVFEGIDNK